MPGRRLCLQPHLLHGYAGDLRRAALPISHSCQEGLVAHRFYRVVPGSFRPDSHRYRQSSRHASSMGAGVKALRSGMPLFVFPEGGRTTTANCRRFSPARPTSPFAPRCRWCPSRSAASSICCRFTPTIFYPGELTLSVGEPIETTGMTPRQANELTARLRDAIQSLRQAASTGAGEASGENAHRAEI